MKGRRAIFAKKQKIDLSYFLDMLITHRLRARSPRLIKKRGTKFAVFANDEVGLSVNLHGVYEADELDFLFEFLRPFREEFLSGLVIDIGANIGNHAIYFSKIFQKVEAFEPNPETFELLEFNSRRVKNVQCHQMALGDRLEYLSVVEDPANIGGARLQSLDAVAGNVEVRTLDSFAMNWQKPCFMKLDVEGFESKVLIGAVELLKIAQPFVVLEQHENDFSRGSTPAIEILRANGYVFCWQEIGVDGRRGLMRKATNLFEFMRGRRRLMVTGYPVPRRVHSMLLAVPRRAASILGI